MSTQATSIGYFAPTGSSNGWSVGSFNAASVPGIGFNLVDSTGAIELGGGMNGYMPQPFQPHDSSDSFSRMRFTLKDAWNTHKYPSARRIITPFRWVNNAGDYLSRDSYTCGGSNQVSQSRPGLYGLGQSIGDTGKSCKPNVWYNVSQLDTAVPSSTCNNRFVYDGSDYAKYKRQLAMNNTYNKRKWGGDDYHAGQSVIRAIRRY